MDLDQDPRTPRVRFCDQNAGVQDRKKQKGIIPEKSKMFLPKMRCHVHIHEQTSDSHSNRNIAKLKEKNIIATPPLHKRRSKKKKDWSGKI